MTSVSFSLYARCAMTAAGAAMLIAAAVPAAIAQPVGYQDRESYQGNGEEVQVIAPRPAGRTSIGAPIENVALSRDVRVDDLDLRTHSGIRILRARISSTAHMLCRQMNTMYVPLSDNPPCYQTAVRTAWRQARAAIDEARYAD